MIFNNNDLKVLCDIIQGDTGILKGKGTKTQDIVNATKLSLTTVNNSLKKLVAEGYADYGIKYIRSNTYIITQKGKDFIKELKGSD